MCPLSVVLLFASLPPGIVVSFLSDVTLSKLFYKTKYENPILDSTYHFISVRMRVEDVYAIGRQYLDQTYITGAYLPGVSPSFETTVCEERREGGEGVKEIGLAGGERVRQGQ